MKQNYMFLIIKSLRKYILGAPTLLVMLSLLQACSSGIIPDNLIPGSEETRDAKTPSEKKFGLRTVRDEPTATRWDVYYSNLENAPAEVRVMEPLGTSRPMGKLLAASVAEQLERAGIRAVMGPLVDGDNKDNKIDEKNIYILSGTAEVNETDPRVRYVVLIRWLLTDIHGSVVATHSQGVNGTKREWDVGDPRLIRSVGTGIAKPIASIVNVEVVAATPEPPADPLTKGILLAGIKGITEGDGKALRKGLAKELLLADIFVTEDERQAKYVLGGHIEMIPTKPGFEMTRIVWRVSEINGEEMGKAVQEKEVPIGSLDGKWADVAPRISNAAAKGIAKILADFSRTPVVEKPEGLPPRVVLPEIPGRAPPPPP